MRLIASFEDEQQAKIFHAVLDQAGVECLCDISEDSSAHILKHHVWVIKEEDIDKALNLYEDFKKNPSAVSVEVSSFKKPDPVFQTPIYEKASGPAMRIRLRFPITRWLILICIAVFFWNLHEKSVLKKMSASLAAYWITPLNTKLMYDAPEVFDELNAFFLEHPEVKMEDMKQWPQATLQEFVAINQKPLWKGFYNVFLEWPQASTLLEAPWFVKISQGDLWRLWTPCILHGNFLHILFNMLWLWLLGRQVEFKLGAIRYILVMLLLGVVSNTAQYLMSGPLFLGYSGIISGLGGFIWVRQKLAPWEGYAIPKATLLFLFVFIAGMVLFQTGVFIIMKYELVNFSFEGIGNTSHVVGVLCGMLLAKIPAFYRLKT